MFAGVRLYVSVCVCVCVCVYVPVCVYVVMMQGRQTCNNNPVAPFIISDSPYAERNIILYVFFLPLYSETLFRNNSC